MTRSDLVEELASRFSQLTRRDAEFAVKAILDAMNDALVRGHRIEIRGFGSFSINRRPPRIGRNPRSGESVAIPEKRVPHFKPGKALREAVDERTAAMLLVVVCAFGRGLAFGFLGLVPGWWMHRRAAARARHDAAGAVTTETPPNLIPPHGT